MTWRKPFIFFTMKSISMEKKKEVVSFLLEKGVIVSQDFLEALEDEDTVQRIYTAFSSSNQDLLFLNKDLHRFLGKAPELDLNFKEFEKAATVYEKTKNKDMYDKFISYVDLNLHEKDEPKKVEVINSYDLESKKRSLQDFVAYFNTRYKMLEKFLRERQELANVTSINRIRNKKEIESVAVIGMVKEKSVTKNGNTVLTIEDMTGEINVLVNKVKPEIAEMVKDIVYDEMVGIIGTTGNNIIFANNIIQPDIPLTKEFKKSPLPGSVAFISDIHFGSKYFLKEDFEKFIAWLRGETGSEKQRAAAQSVQYLFVVGDLVDGVGIYPGQEEELHVRDVKEQYKGIAHYLSQIPERIQLILCPGNHDAVRLSEPQPLFAKEFSAPLYSLPNATIVSNPAYIRIHAGKGFQGFTVLLYHGYSFDHYIANVDTIRNQGGYDRADLVMKFLLKRRHLAPTHTSTLYVPDPDKDALVIDKVPDFFVTGHIHKTAVGLYRNITLVSGSCWQSTTPFQIKVGHHPEPSRVPLVDLQTRKVKILKFGDEENA